MAIGQFFIIIIDVIDVNAIVLIYDRILLGILAIARILVLDILIDITLARCPSHINGSLPFGRHDSREGVYKLVVLCDAHILGHSGGVRGWGRVGDEVGVCGWLWGQEGGDLWRRGDYRNIGLGVRVVVRLAMESNDANIGTVVGNQNHGAALNGTSEAYAGVESGGAFAEGIKRVIAEQLESLVNAEGILLHVEKPEVDDTLLIAATQDMNPRGGIRG